MILRILGEGQFEVADHTVEALNGMDNELQAAIDSGDEAAFHTALAGLLALVREVGQPVPDDHLGPSDLVLPAAESTLEEVRALLGNEGLIPG
jgi:PspAA-like protein